VSATKFIVFLLTFFCLTLQTYSPLAKNSRKLRSSVAYQLCRTLPGVSMTSDTDVVPHNAGLVAMVMGLGCKFLKRSRHKSSIIKRQSTSVDYQSNVHFSQYGYSSLRQLQQAIVPVLRSCGLGVQGKPVNAVTAVELSFTLCSVLGLVCTDSADQPEVLCNNISLKCNFSKESTTSGTQSLLFDMEKPLKLTTDKSQSLNHSEVKACGTVRLELLQVSTSVHLVRYVTMVPTVNKLLEASRSPSDAAIVIEGGIDEADAPSCGNELDPFSHGLVLALMAADNTTTNNVSVPVLVGTFPSSQQQTRQFPELPTPSSLDGLLQAEEGHGSDHPASGNLLQVPFQPVSGSESVSAGISDEVDYSTRTPSPDSAVRHLLVGNDTENSSKTSTSFFLLFHFNEIILSAEVFPFKAAIELQKLTGSVSCNFDQPSKKQLSGKLVLPLSANHLYFICIHLPLVTNLFIIQYSSTVHRF